MDEAILFGMSKLKYEQLRENQRNVICAYLNGKDVFFCSPTGSGKSLTFEIAPFVFSHLYHSDALPALTSSVIVISPLVDLMRTQVKKLKSFGLKVFYISDVTDGEHSEDISMADIKCGKFDILVCSPESLLGEQRSLVRDLSEKKMLRAIFVDEAQFIVKFGKPCPVTERPAIRPAYGQLGELRSLAGPSVPFIALTTAASVETMNIIKEDLCFDDSFDVILSPNKLNIKYEVIEMKSDDTRTNFKWLIHLLENQGINTPRMIIFFRKIKHMALVYKHVINTLGQKAYINYDRNGSNDDRNRIIDMIHTKTTDVVKASICRSCENPEGFIRVVLCTTPFPMGIDIRGFHLIVHYGPAKNLEDYIQETDRAGRSTGVNYHAILLKYERSFRSKNISQDMKEYMSEIACRRKRLLQLFPNDITESVPLHPPHTCCDNCAKLCKCTCKCVKNVCSCEKMCDATNNPVTQSIINTIDSDESSSEELD